MAISRSNLNNIRSGLSTVSNAIRRNNKLLSTDNNRKRNTFSSTRLHDSSTAQQKIERYTETKQSAELMSFPSEYIKYYTRMSYSRYTRTSSGEQNAGSLLFNVGFQRIGSIYLPLPTSGLIDTQTVQYDEEELQALGGAATIGQGIGDAFFNGASTSKILKDAAGGVGGQVPTVQALYGVAPNKFMTMLLKGPTYKKHSFTWNLVPSNFKESQIINRIVVKMNNLMAPGIRASGLLWDFPYIFYIEWKPNPGWLYKFKPMVLNNFTVDYTANGQKVPAFYGTSSVGPGENPPESVQIKCDFIELEYWLRNQYNQDSESSWTGRHRHLAQAGNLINSNEGVESLSDQIGKDLFGEAERRAKAKKGNNEDEDIKQEY